MPDAVAFTHYLNKAHETPTPLCPRASSKLYYWISPLWAGGRPTRRNILSFPDALSPACSSNPAGPRGQTYALIASASSPTPLLPCGNPIIRPHANFLLQDAAGPPGCSDTVCSSSGNFCKIISLKHKDSSYPVMLCVCLFLVFLGQCTDIWLLPHFPVQSS